MKSIRHRRGDIAEWESVDPIIPDGEIALVKRDTGYDIAIGDGKTQFNDLRTFGGRIIKNSTDYIIEVTLRSGDDIRLDVVEELYLDLELPIPDDFFAMISFTSYNYQTAFSIPEDTNIYFTGTDCSEGIFCPIDYMRYNLFLFYDGTLQGIVRGYYYE